MKRMSALAALAALVLALVPGGARAHTVGTRKYVGSIDTVAFLFHFFENCDGDHVVGSAVGGLGGACWTIPSGHRTGTFTIRVTDATGLRVPYFVTQRNAASADVATRLACGTSPTITVVPSAETIHIWMMSTSFALSACAAAAPGTAGPPTTGTAVLTMSA